MESGLSLSSPGRAWVGLAALLGLGSLLAWMLPTPWLDWQPGLAATQPWRAWTSAFVHWSAMHLQANLLGLAVVAAFGWVGRLPVSAAIAWLLAWPCVQFGLLLMPGLAHFGGLSGVLHAGVAVAAVFALALSKGRPRTIGGAVLIGLGLKVLLERPWGPALRFGDGWDIAVAPIAHATGLVSGLGWALSALGLRGWARRRSPWAKASAAG